MTSNHRFGIAGCPSSRWLVFALFLSCALLTPWAVAEPPQPAPPTVSGTPLSPAPAPEKAARHGTSAPNSVPSFTEGLTSNDAAFEVLFGEGRILTLKENIAVPGQPQQPVITVGDPNVIDFALVNLKQIRVVGLRLGVTDLSIVTPDNRVYSFEVRVVADLNMLRAQLQSLYPDASLKVTQVRDNLVVEGQARDSAQVNRILSTIQAFLTSIQEAQDRRRDSGPLARIAIEPGRIGPEPVGAPAASQIGGSGQARLNLLDTLSKEYYKPPAIINLIRVPSTQQVLLQVRVAELNRTALREIGADVLFAQNGNVVGTQIGGGTIGGSSVLNQFGNLVPSIDPTRNFFNLTNPNGNSKGTTVFGIFQGAHFAFLLRALRANSIMNILAEPNLVTMNGQQASFLAGGEFPVPIPQTSTGGAGTSVTVMFKEFGVKLGFLPFILDGDVIRLTVDPEVSQIDFAIGTTLVPGGSLVPGLDSRKAHTTVEMHQGQTLAIAGLLQLEMDGTTDRIPGLGDLPILGPFFSATTSGRTEKELIVLVTPYLIEPMNACQVPPSPGDEVKGPTDLEFYFLNRIEGRTGRDGRSTTEYDDPLHVLRCFMKLHNQNVVGPHGFCD